MVWVGSFTMVPVGVGEGVQEILQLLKTFDGGQCEQECDVGEVEKAGGASFYSCRDWPKRTRVAVAVIEHSDRAGARCA